MIDKAAEALYECWASITHEPVQPFKSLRPGYQVAFREQALAVVNATRGYIKAEALNELADQVDHPAFELLLRTQADAHRS